MLLDKMTQLLFHFLDIKVMTSVSKRHYEQSLESYCLLVIAKGTATITIGDDQYRLLKNSIYICPPQDTYALKVDLKNATTAYLIRFDTIFKNPKHVEENHFLIATSTHEVGKEINLALMEEITNLCNNLVSLSDSPIKEDLLLRQAQFYLDSAENSHLHRWRDECNYSFYSAGGGTPAESR